MVPVLIKDLLSSKPEGQKVTVCGWVRTVRDSKGLVFIQVNDGSSFANIQLTFDRNNPSNNANVMKSKLNSKGSTPEQVSALKVFLLNLLQADRLLK